MSNTLQGKAKNLGQVAGMVYSATAPSNLRVLWYDTTNNLIKEYKTSQNAWIPLGGSTNVPTIPNSDIDALN